MSTFFPSASFLPFPRASQPAAPSLPDQAFEPTLIPLSTGAIIVVVVSVIAISTASTASKPPTPPPSIEELGVRPPVNGGEAEGEGNGAAGWFWSSTGASLARKNEGEEG